MFTTSGIELGGLTIYWYAIIIVTGAIFALSLVIAEAKKFGVESERIIDIFFAVMIGGIIGTRLYYVIFQWDAYRNNLWEIFNFRAGGLAIYGGLIGGAIIIYIAAKGWLKFGRFQIKPFNGMLLLDFIAPVLLLAQGIGRWGNFVNKEAYGAVVPGGDAAAQIAYLKGLYLPDFIINGMYIHGQYRQPTFLYESVWDMLGFIVLYFIIRKYKKLKLSTLLASYLVWYGAGRYVVEGMRTDSLYLFADIRVSQVVSIIFVLAGIVLLLLNYFRANHVPRYSAAKFEGSYPFLRKILDK
jgi:phosphatidylglycerol:prolipoprotein diacylglycerol transferase